MDGDSRRDRPEALPLDEPWWESDAADDDWMPHEDVPLLGPYERVEPGFELVHSSVGAGFFPEAGDGFHRLCLWNIWDKDTDPADTDEEKRAINEMQQSLGVLSDDDRYLRIQIACLQRCFWTFARNVDLILEGIGNGRPSLDAPVSCEPPWSGIMAVLRQRRGHPAPLAGRMQMPETKYDRLQTPESLIRVYINILTWWTFDGDLQCLQDDMPEHRDLAETIYRRLGRPDKVKRLYVGKLRAALSWQAFPRTGFEKDACKEAMAVYEAAISEHLDGTDDEIGRQIGPLDTCHHAFFRRVDHQIANIGAGQLVRLQGAGQERRRIFEAVTNYVHALGSWVADRTIAEATSAWPPSAETVDKVYRFLGGSSSQKRWLVACVWKTLQDNQAHHGRGALDEQPERFAIPPDALRLEGFHSG